MYDYGARHYDPSLGRWFVVDPLSEEYYTQSTYHFSGNNPMRYVDMNGMNYDDWIIDINDNSVKYFETNSLDDTFFIYDGFELLDQFTMQKNHLTGHVLFPENGKYFGGYGPLDEGPGILKKYEKGAWNYKLYGDGDRYIEPVVAAHLLGLTYQVNEKYFNYNVLFGDMSDSYGLAPGAGHKTHDGINCYSGRSIDYWEEGYNSRNYKNHVFLDAANDWGFGLNYYSTAWNMQYNGIDLPFNKGIKVMDI